MFKTKSPVAIAISLIEPTQTRIGLAVTRFCQVLLLMTSKTAVGDFGRSRTRPGFANILERSTVGRFSF